MSPPRRYFECHDPQGDWISDLERQDEERRHEAEFGVRELADEDARDKVLRSTDGGQVEE